MAFSALGAVKLLVRFLRLSMNSVLKAALLSCLVLTCFARSALGDGFIAYPNSIVTDETTKYVSIENSDHPVQAKQITYVTDASFKEVCAFYRKLGKEVLFNPPKSSHDNSRGSAIYTFDGAASYEDSMSWITVSYPTFDGVKVELTGKKLTKQLTGIQNKTKIIFTIRG